ncbi:hypothetical protein GCM10017653_37310 [Ancylobacter defluvii]|uniref:Uncharacterized protein n=1 Tax=Ancylobacter defluvii TaxID=1282440 RepID=A0A9W6NCK4_9HYPH|nr:hypothetical protein GCM10017653_37310 [Ancylobacter defluvii]
MLGCPLTAHEKTVTDNDFDQMQGPNETAAYIEALAAELARIAAAERLHMLHYLLEMAREEAATIARRTTSAAGDPSLR